VAMAAGFAALEQLLAPGFYEELERKTQTFCHHIQSYCDRQGYEVRIQQIASIFWIAFTPQRVQRADQIDPASMERFKILHRELLLRGLYLGPSGYEVGFVSAAHTVADLEEAAAKVNQAMDVVFS
jgi:glutamate-1-semialdehyde 2,1-aminomutase